MNKIDFISKARINSSNGQANISLPKRKIDKETFDKIMSSEKLRVILEDL